MKLKNSLLLCTMCFVFIQFVNGQGKQDFLFTKGDNDISTITIGIGGAHCTVIEYPDFLVLHEIPIIPVEKKVLDSKQTNDIKENPLIAFIDSIYLDKPIKYILNSHSHGHSLSTVTPFLDKGAILVTTKENIKIYDKRGLFGDKTSSGYVESIIPITTDTVLLTNTKNPIEVLHLNKSEHKHIPTATFLFFHFPAHKLLATSCMVYLLDFHKNQGFKGTIYSGRITDVNELIADKKLDVENTMQLYNFRYENEERKLPLFSLSYLQNVIKHGWSRQELADHFLENVSYEELTTKQDSLLNFFVELRMYTVITNYIVYELINRKEYKKAVAFAQLQTLYRPDSTNLLDTLGEAYYNNGQIDMAKHYDKLVKKLEPSDDGLGIAMWEKNQKERLEKDKI